MLRRLQKVLLLPVTHAVVLATFAIIGALYLSPHVNQVVSYKIWGVAAVVTGVLGCETVLLFAWLARRRLLTITTRVWSGLYAGVITITAISAGVAGIAVRAHRHCFGVARECGANMETAVVERSGQLLVSTGSPYLPISRLSQMAASDYNPYSPLLSLFGLPAAADRHIQLLSWPAGEPLPWSTSWWADARWFIGLAWLVALALLVHLWRGRQIPLWGWMMGLVVLPVTQNFVAAGIDGLVVTVMVLAAALAERALHTAAGTPSRFTASGWACLSGVTTAVATGMKLTALPMVAIIVVFLWAAYPAVSAPPAVSAGPAAAAGPASPAKSARAGRARLVAAFLGCAGAVTAAVYLPVLIPNPQPFVENVLRYTTGAGQVASTAQGGTPGNLLAAAGPTGALAARVLLGGAIVVVLIVLLWRPPRTVAAVVNFAAWSLLVAMLLMPASRFGYSIYPAVLWIATGWATLKTDPEAVASDPAPVHTQKD